MSAINENGLKRKFCLKWGIERQVKLTWGYGNQNVGCFYGRFR